jgi:MarR family 2-MHQ and catechol resistance regulon transcriptional repressor
LPAYTSKQAAREPFLEVLRELVWTYFAMEATGSADIRRLGLTPPQFDVIATLGNTPGMTFKELGEKTLITKGTLTGVVDRLEAKGLVQRVAAEEDRRSVIARLTPEGENMFEETFTSHILFMKQRFDRLSTAERQQITASLRRLRAVFEE